MSRRTDNLVVSAAQEIDAGNAVRPVGRKSSLFIDLLLAALIATAFIASAELALRAAGVKFEGSFYNPDRELGYVLRPNAEGWNVQENVNYFETNSDGMADREHTLQRPPDTIRIAVVGDSVTEAKHVPRDQAYWAVMELRLNRLLASRGQRVEVLNFGVAGYGLAQESLVIQQRVWKYDPQIILLAGSIESFVLRSTRNLSPSKPSERVPFYVFHDGSLEPDAQTLRERASFQRAGGLHQMVGNLVNSSRFLALVNEGAKKAGEWLRSELRRGVKDPEANAYKETDSFIGPARPDLTAAWNVSKTLILSSRDTARRHHAEFWLFTLDMPQQVDFDDAARNRFQKSLGLTDLFLTDHLFAQFAAANDIPHGALAPELLDFAERNGVILHGFPGTPRNSGHWNQTGHRVAGEMIADQLINSSQLFLLPHKSQ